MTPPAGPRATPDLSAREASRSGEVSPEAPTGTLAARIVTAPHMIDAPAARTCVAAWLAGLDAAEASPLEALIAAHPVVRTLLESISESSPFLWDLASREPARLLRLLNADPDEHLAALLSEHGHAAANTDDDAEAMRLLRRMKAEAALLIALADIGGAWPVMRATRALTDLADTAVDAAVRFALREAARAGRIVLNDTREPQQGSGYIVLAMGKMGAFELNYSSDIDLVVFYDPASPLVPAGGTAGAIFVRITQRVVKLLQERTGDGYVFRTDLRLRPDPASTGIAISTAAAISYYESVGQNWERAMMIKARACAGDIAAGDKVLDDLIPFVWRKYLDFAAVADIRAMKRQINAYRGHGEIAVEGHNIKLGRGGIREVEFFAQTQQLIAGGRNPALRDRDTLTTLDKLAEDRWIDAQARDEMTAAYLFLRTLEHRLQMVNDEQTQTLPAEREGLERFARFLGYPDRDTFAAVLLGHLDKVQRNYGRLFEKAAEPDEPALLFPPEADDRKTLDRLGALGFTSPLEASHIVRHWLAGGHRSLKGEIARSHLEALLPLLIDHLARTDNPNAALVLFDHFLANLHGPARLLSLLQQNPELITLITLVLGIAPRLADTLARHPEVMDALVDPSFFGALPDEAELGRRLTAALAQSRYAEDLLERIRRFGLEYMFLIGVRILTGTVTARQAGEAFARLADAVIRAVTSAVQDNFTAAYGRLRAQETAVLAMGKLGGNEMTATSDLDLILVYDFDETQPDSDGDRSLYGAQYFARLTQRLINALTARTNYGALYQVDMRLRPSGRAGPLATLLAGFASYQETEAWTWEHMALTRARVVSASPAFKERVESVIREVLRRPRDAAQIAGDVVEMRAAIATEKGDSQRWDLKYVAGGLVDIEFIAQYLQLVHAHRLPGILDTSTARVLDKAWALRVLPVEDAEVLRPAVQLYQDLTQILRLCLPGPFDPKAAGPGLLRLLARAGGLPNFTMLEATLAETQAKVRESFVRILGRAP
ncbi:MAG TPA: bifunctional [glutamine synthetase] adenylyltransferase/[glutamine synthetase]-adenylyl-L-tyrosine phosphorylase [Pseudolabrys sp.]|jgi:glutamate-ammonia-ligase adenylyltransferase|nr:bifunctional [glutamine synthetase] adenylyltransferase/[glutamine synthetase]-adenylyl-L-tyrosine phosphorylase [Pseudolabrys sp.]